MKSKLINILFVLFVFISPSFTAESSNDEVVRVYVWNSGVFGGEHYGHVSLKTSNAYVSLWPSDQEHDRNRLDLPDGSCVKAIATTIRNYEGDKQAEGRFADSIYFLQLKSESVRNIERTWEQLSRSGQLIWFALGTNVSGFDNSQLSVNMRRHLEDFENPFAFNCASIVYHLLKLGGLNNLDSHVQGVLCPHGPVAQALIGSWGLKIDLLNPQGIKFLEKIIYPDKLGYMIRHHIVNKIKLSLNYRLDLLDDSKVDFIWNTYLKPDADANNIEKADSNKDSIESYIKGEFDRSFPGKIYNKKYGAE